MLIGGSVVACDYEHRMKEKRLSPDDVLALACREEGHFFDRKAKEVDGKKIQKVAVAFANADGGDFVVGIKDDNDEADPAKRWSGSPSKEYFNKVFQNLAEVTPSIPYTPIFLFNAGDNTWALQVIVEKSAKVHNTADQTIYVRRSAQSLPIRDPQRIQELSFAKGDLSFEDMPLVSARAEDVFETLEMRRFLNDYSPKSDPIDFTVNQNLVDRTTYEPRVAGVLLFNDNPTSLMSKKCAIRISRYDTSEKVPEREHLKEQETVEGSLYEQIHKAAEAVSKIMSSVKIWTPSGLNAVSYPPETIWEILVNAVIHRDYSISDDIHIHIFNNRIVILSPGKLPGYVTVKNILESRYSRNSKIVRTLNRYRNPPNKDMGEGLNTAFQKMKDWKLKDPIIQEEGNYVKATISHSALATPDEAIMEYLNHHPRIRNREAREITGIKSENVMKTIFYRLRDNGLIEPIVSPKGKKIIAWKKV